MKSIRNLAALFLLASALCAAAAMAQPAGPGNLTQDSFTLTRVAGPNVPVNVFLQDDPGPALWQVVAGSAENAAKLSWNVDARCATRLKSLSVKHANGTQSFQNDLTPTTRNLQKQAILPTFSSIKQLCLDIANGSFDSANGDAVKIHELKILQNTFKNSADNSATTWVQGQLLLSGQCTSANGESVVTNVVDKKFPAEIQIRCAVQ
jgi:hypothetical protein